MCEPEIPFEIIDCHIHPPVTPEHDTSWFFKFDSLAAFVAKMQSFGISRACGSVIKRLEPDSFAPTAELNRLSLEAQKAFPEAYVPAIHIDPRYPDASCKELETYYHKHGVRWIGELVGYMMGYGGAYLQEGCEPVYALAQELGVPVNFHTHEPAVIDRMCKTFPKVKFVLAHPHDSRPDVNNRIALVASHPNLHLDLSGSGVMRYGMIRYAIDEAGAEKILFGTDFPICNPAKYIHCVLTEELTDKEREAVFAGNFKRLTGLK